MDILCQLKYIVKGLKFSLKKELMPFEFSDNNEFSYLIMKLVYNVKN